MMNLESLEALDAFVSENPAAAVYFAGEQCQVCQVMEPKVWALLEERFPRIARGRALAQAGGESTALAAQHRIFAVPTVLIFFEGRETFRYARTFGLAEVEADLSRPYGLFFDD
ncbi:MAG: thioredoxin family protein [Deltaproteobacteria bacterium]|nr:thioredoxin family protein [Deltaproteobacteria bacterium]